jgi:hypothetical protein
MLCPQSSSTELLSPCINIVQHAPLTVSGTLELTQVEQCIPSSLDMRSEHNDLFLSLRNCLTSLFDVFVELPSLCSHIDNSSEM